MNALLASLLLLKAAPVAVSDATNNRSWQLWALNCQGCHRPDASGTPDGVPPMSGVVAKFLQVPGGRQFLVQVPGVATAPIRDDDLAQLLNWMLPHFDAANMPADFKPYTTAEVRALRRKPLGTKTNEMRAYLIGLMP